MPDSLHGQSVSRAELIEIVEQASAGCAESTRARVLKVAETTDAVAVGWWHCNGVSCPIRQAGWRTSIRFTEAFDRIMADRLGLPFAVAHVVRVR